MRYLKIYLIPLVVLAAFVFVSCSSEGDSFSPSSESGGQGGSLARFAVVGDFIYTVNNTSLTVFDISNPANTTLVKTENIDFGIETIFPKGNLLFIGSTTGMYIYDISNPADPIYISEYNHIQACDPVVANDSLAFVTLRSGGSCRLGFTSNQLDIIDITDIQNPNIINTLPLNNPFGLGLNGNHVFVCDGTFGLKVLDFSDPQNLVEVNSIVGYTTYDVIAYTDRILVVGPETLCQYDITDINDLQEISCLSFNL